MYDVSFEKHELLEMTWKTYSSIVLLVTSCFFSLDIFVTHQVSVSQFAKKAADVMVCERRPLL